MITYLKGDATYPQGDGLKLIIHVCNNRRVWGAGFVLAISKRWKEPKQIYISSPRLTLGTIQTISVESDIIVVNMIAQTLYNRVNGVIPLNYTALEICLRKVNTIAVENSLTIHAPRFGAGLAGGDWTTIETLIDKIITVPIFIYDLN